jgi:hypothetical protein
MALVTREQSSLVPFVLSAGTQPGNFFFEDKKGF